MNNSSVIYQNYSSTFSVQKDELAQIAQTLFTTNNYAQPENWFKASALCFVALTNDFDNEVFYKLYEQINEKSHREFSSFLLNDTDYAQWFADVEATHQLFVTKDYYKAYSFLHEMYLNARFGFKDEQKAIQYLKQGEEHKDATSISFVGYNTYYGNFGFVEDKAKGLQMIESSYSNDNHIGKLFALNIEFNACTSEEEGRNVIEKYKDFFEQEKRGLYIKAEYYLREEQEVKAAEALQEGIANGCGYSNYLMGMLIANGRFDALNFSKEKGIAYLEYGFACGIAYSGFVLGYYYLYPTDGSEPNFLDAIPVLEKAALYGSNEALLELAVLYLYHSDYQNIATAIEYLDRAIATNFTKAMNEKAVALLEHPNVLQDVAAAKELLEKATELGDDYAPYRLGLAYQYEEIEVENADQLAIQYFEIAANRDNVKGIEAAGRYYRYKQEPEINKALEFYRKGIDLFQSNYCKVELAMLLENGFVVEKNVQIAKSIYEDALQSNYPYAAIRLGFMHEDGVLGERNYEAAREYFSIAAEADMPEGIYQLARFYRYGIGGEENHQIAFELFEKALQLGYSDANVDLALAYEEGAGVEHQPQQAFDYMAKAAELGYGFAQYKLGCYYLYDYGVQKDLQQAKHWLEQAVDNQSVLAMLTLGDYYLYGYEQDQPYEKCFPYYQAAEELGGISEGIGVCYQFGIGIDQSEEKAFQYYQKAIENNYDAAYFRLGICYFYGIGTQKNANEALVNLRIAADRGNMEASAYTGVLLMEQQEWELGVPYLEEAAHQGFDMAQYELGNCYLKGEGVPQSDETALHWYQQAAENGNEDAQRIVGGPRKRRR